MSAIKTPLTFDDTAAIVNDACGKPWTDEELRLSAGGFSMFRFRFIKLVMAVDVASREQERERSARLAEDEVCHHVAVVIRDPFSIPRGRS